MTNAQAEKMKMLQQQKMYEEQQGKSIGVNEMPRPRNTPKWLLSTKSIDDIIRFFQAKKQTNNYILKPMYKNVVDTLLAFSVDLKRRGIKNIDGAMFKDTLVSKIKKDRTNMSDNEHRPIVQRGVGRALIGRETSSNADSGSMMVAIDVPREKDNIYVGGGVGQMTIPKRPTTSYDEDEVYKELLVEVFVAPTRINTQVTKSDIQIAKEVIKDNVKEEVENSSARLDKSLLKNPMVIGAIILGVAVIGYFGYKKFIK